MQIEGVVQQKSDLNGTPSTHDQGVAICYETAPLYTMGAVGGSSGFTAGLETTASLPPSSSAAGAAPPTPSKSSSDDTTTAALQQSNVPSNQEKFQAEIIKWEELYDQIHHRLTNKANNASKEKHLPKSASNFSMSQDGELFYSKLMKDGSVLYLKVIRDYTDRVRICREIHLDTDDVTLHHRRDKMLEILGQMYFWKGQRRDVCQCVSKSHNSTCCKRQSFFILPSQIASCAVCSAGLGAKRKAKPPGQKRDIPRSGPDPPKKKVRVGKKPHKNLPLKEKEEINRTSLVNSEALLVGSELSMASAIQIAEVVNQHNQQQDSLDSSGVGVGVGNASVGDSSLSDTFVSAGERDSANSLSASDVSFHQIFTTIEDQVHQAITLWNMLFQIFPL